MSTHNIHFECKNEYHNKLSQICSHSMFSQGLKNEFKTAVVYESSVFKPLKFYFIISTFRSFKSFTLIGVILKTVSLKLTLDNVCSLKHEQN